MRYKNFRIKNFKGIKDATVELGTGGSASVYTFVGLNESGKTTLLEAIHSFSPDDATTDLVGSNHTTVAKIKESVPRHQLSSFTGDISITATIVIEEGDIATIARRLKADGIYVDEEAIPQHIVIERHHRFKFGDFQSSYLTLRTPISVKTGKQKKWRSPTGEEAEKLRTAFYGSTPDIAYFPTFVFNFPDQIFLTPGRGGKANDFYRAVFQDILDFDGKGLKLDEHVVRRIRNPQLTKPWLSFLTLWKANDDGDKVQHVMDRAGAIVTSVVFGRWDKIFREDAKGKEVLIEYDVVQGERADSQGNLVKTEEHDIVAKFLIRDGSRRFDVNARSLGFRWFFAFMLFTQFRAARGITRPVFFLFDEPASNLHAAAQQKLLESFPHVAKGKHVLAYTTHSHYMIEPKWLEQTFIVTNRSDGPPGSMVEALSLDDESLDVRAWPYAEFINNHPSQTSYFQPVMDRLDVVPSRLDIQKSSIVVEGKSDYYALRYASRLTGAKELPLLPGLGAGTFGALVAMHLGWGLKALFLLDGDKKGKQERERYVTEFGLPIDRALTIDELVANVKEIEDLLDDEARAIISKTLSLKQDPTKNQIRRFFQEHLASDSVVPLGAGFSSKATALLSELATRLGQ